jgi:hypothetical protein
VDKNVSSLSWWQSKVKFPLCLCNTPWIRMGEREYSSAHFNPRWRWVVNYTPRPLSPQGKSPRNPLVRSLGGLQSRSGRCGEEKDPCLWRETNPSYLYPIAYLINIEDKFFLFFIPPHSVKTFRRTPLGNGSIIEQHTRMSVPRVRFHSYNFLLRNMDQNKDALLDNGLLNVPKFDL